MVFFISELKEAFIIFDKDNDKKINMKELATVMRSIGFSPTQADLQNIAQESGATHGKILQCHGQGKYQTILMNLFLLYKFLYVHDVQTGQKYLKTYNFTYIFKIKVQFSK